MEERFGRTFQSVNNRDDHDNLRAFVLASGYCLQSAPTACRDIINDSDPLTLKSFAGGDPFEQFPRPMFLRSFSDEEPLNWISLFKAELANRPSNWHCAHLKAPDKLRFYLQKFRENTLCNQIGPLRI